MKEVGDALIEGKMPRREAALFVGGAIEAFLREGGSLSLDRDFLRVRGVRGSHTTAAVLSKKERAP